MTHRGPITFKKCKNPRVTIQRSTESKLEDLKAKQREIKAKMLRLLEKSQTHSVTKLHMQDELFKIYLDIK